MNVTIYIKESEFDDFVSFYNKVNENRLLDKSEIPNIDLSQKPKPSLLQISLHHDIYQAMIYANTEMKKRKLFTTSTPKNISEVDSLMKEAENLKLSTEVVYSALEAMKQDDSLSIEEALKAGLVEWDIL